MLDLWKQVQGIMLVAAVADTAAKMSQLMVSSSVATAAALGPVRTRSLSFQSSAAGEWQSTPNALSMLQAGCIYFVSIIFLATQ